MVMGLTTVPRNIARLEYSAMRLPLTLLEEHVVARYWDDEAVLRLGFERFLGSLDGIAGRLLADNDLARRGQALILRTEYLAMADELEARAQAGRLAEEGLQAERATARRARQQANAEMDANAAAAVQREQEEKRQRRRAADAQARAKKARAERAARKRAAQAGKAPSGPSASSARRRPSGRATGS
jgi:hypothetical protein